MTRGAWGLVVAVVALAGCGSTTRQTHIPSTPTPGFDEVSVRDVFPSEQERQAYVRGYRTCSAFARAGDYEAMGDYVLERRLAPDGTAASAEAYACVDADSGAPLPGSGIN